MVSRCAGVALAGMIWTSVPCRVCDRHDVVLILAVVVVSGGRSWGSTSVAGVARLALMPHGHAGGVIAARVLGADRLVDLAGPSARRAKTRGHADARAEGTAGRRRWTAWTLVGAVVAVTAIVAWLRPLHARREEARIAAGARTMNAAEPARRLIVHPIIATVLIAAALLGATAMLLSMLTA